MKEANGIRRHLQIQYRVSKVNPADVQDKFTQEESEAEAALFRISHISALFELLRAVDVEGRWVDEGIVSGRLYALSSSINGIGELGSYIADGLYSNIAELYDAYKEAVGDEAKEGDK